MARQDLRTRSAGYPATLLLAPAGCFRMGPLTLMQRMSELGSSPGEAETAAWTPSIEVSQTDDKYVVRAELPGINPSDVKLEVTNNALILEGERKPSANENQGGVQMSERQYGKFYRIIPLPEGAKAEEAKARYENGVLEVAIPVQRKEQSRQIPIEATNTSPQGT